MEEKYSGICFQVKITPHSRRKQKTEDEDTDVVLMLAPFSKYPKIVFSSVKVGTSKRQHIIVRNPNDSRVEVQLDRLPPEKHGLTFSAVKFGVEAHEDKVIEVIWTPCKPESWHHVIQVKNSHHLRLDIGIACTSVDPQMGKKRNVKPLRAQNTSLNASLTAKKGGVKPLSHSTKKGGVKPLSHLKSEVSLRVQKSRPPNRSFRPALSTDKLKQGYSISDEKFTSIQGNRLPPCSLPSTPTRRETYVVMQDNGESDKENAEFKQLKHTTKSANDTYVTRKSTEYESPSSFHNDSPELTLPPCRTRGKFSDKNAELQVYTAVSSSHPDHNLPCTIARNRVKTGSNTISPSGSNQNFLNILNGLAYTPTSSSLEQEQQEVAPNVESSSPEDSVLPPCTVSPTPVRRQTYAIPPVSGLRNESPMQFPEETVVISSRVTRVRSTRSVNRRTRIMSDEFNDSLEAQNDVFKQESVLECGTERWSEWQNHYFSRSEGSSKGSTGIHCESVHSSPRSNMCSTGLTPDLDKLNFDVSFSFHSGSPVDFSMLLPTEDTHRCSTITKTAEKMSYDPAYNTIRKDLFSADVVKHAADPIPPDELNHLRSETFVKSSYSYCDMNLKYPDMNCEQSSSHQNSCQLDQDRTKPHISLNLKDNSAQSVIEAGLWVKESSSEKLAKTAVSANFNLDATAEERKFAATFSLKEQKLKDSKGKSAIPMKQTKKPERDESAGVFLEISPPRGQIYDLCGSITKTQRTSQITGWSKTSVNRRNYPHINIKEGASCQPGVKASKLIGKKRPHDDSKTNETVRKRRILNDDSIRKHGNKISRDTPARRPLRSSCSSVPRTLCTKLTLSKTKKQKEESVQLHNSDAVLNKLANPGLFEATNTTEPFTTSSVYFDEEWMVQQEKEFTKCLNSLLTPPEELSSTTALPKVDVTELWIQSCRKQDVVPAPTREMVSCQYNTHHRLDALRKAACALFRSQEVAEILSKVAVHVDKKLIAIRSDRDLHLDFGLKCNVMNLLLSYNPLWLRIALEAVYGQTIPLESNSDVQGLTKFIATRLLSDPYIVQQYSYPTVSHLFRPGYEDAMKKFTLKKFLLLVYFLDRAKERKLISHDPCLFCKDAELKDSRQILLAFSRDLLSGVGDITKHLKSLGYAVTQSQTYLDEFEYAVSCLGRDLRDGIRLTRVMEIILQNRTLSNELRVPPVSRLQKIHNVDVALSALKGAGYVLTGNITARDISDGHREKTLSLLWQIIYKFQEPRFINAAKKIQKWWHSQSLKLEIYRRIQAREVAHCTQAATTIQAYWRSYCAQKQLKILKEQEAVKSVARQKASIIIQKNWRMYIEHKKYNCTLNSIKKIQEWYRSIKMARMEQTEYLKRCNTLRNFQAVCRGYLYRRKLENLQQTAAALKIQTWYRRQRACQKIESLIAFIQKCIEEKRLISAAIIVQQKFRATVLMRSERQRFLKQKFATAVIQRRFRATLLMKKQVAWYQQQRHAAVTIQQKFRATLLMRSDRQCFLEQKFAAAVIQRRFRATLLMKKQAAWYQQQRHAAVIIQQKFRATMLRRSDRQRFLEQMCAATVIQRRFRATLLMKKQAAWYQQHRHAAIIIQRKFRATVLMRSERQHFLQQKFAATIIQRRFWAMLLIKKQVRWYQQQRHAAVTIQQKFRATMLMRSDRQRFLEQKFAAAVIQRRFRATLLMKKQVAWYQQQRHAAVIIQQKFRATMLMTSDRQRFLEQKFAAAVIQRRFRATLLMKKQVAWYQQQRHAAVIIQQKFRATMLMTSDRQRFLEQKFAAAVIQRRFRATLLMKKQVAWYQQQRHAAVIIQQKFRATLLMRYDRQHFLQQKFAAAVIQRRFRATLLMKKQAAWYQQQRCAAIIIQKKFRATMLMRSERQHFLQQKFAATIIQRRFRATLLMKKQVRWYQQQRHAAVTIQQKFRATMLMRSDRQHFLEQKFAVVVIQRRFQATLLMKKQVRWYQQQRHAAVTIQQKFRATLLMRSDRQHFLQQKFAAAIIQRRFRAMLLLKKQAAWYQQQRRSAVIIQKKFRATMLMRSERQHFLQQKFAAAVIQRRFRATLLMNKQAAWYQQQRHAAVTIQQKFRATMLMRSDRQHFLEQKFAAAVIQRRFQATLLMKKQAAWYQQQRHAAVTIQQKFRATMLMRSDRQHFLQQKFAAAVIQRRFQATLLMKKQAAWYQQQRRSAVIIQKKFRTTMLMRSERQHFLQQKFAAAIIQSRFQATLLMKKQVRWYQQQRHAAVTIQQKFRATLLMRSERQQFLETKRAATLMQRRFRATKLMKKQAQWYQLQRSAAVIIQVKFRATILMRSERENFLKIKSAAVTIQNKFKARMLGQKERRYFLEIMNLQQKEHRKRTAAAIRIQAVWRGHRERKTGTREMVAVRERALSSIHNALPGTTLQTRYTAALFMLKKVCSGRLIWAFTELDTITQLSPKLCRDIADSDIVKVIYKCLSNANRSEVDKEMSTVATKVLINLTKYENTAASVWQVSGNVGLLLNLMSAWCGKYDPLFCNCCTILWLFAQDPAKSVKILQVPQLQRLFHYHNQLKQKEERAQASKRGASKLKSKCPKRVLPATKPDWSLTGACQPQTFECPLHAVSCVIKQLKLIA